jgi:glycerophosphoryl diester phosphodiesterase
LSRLDAGAWHGRAFAGEPFPSLEVIANYCIDNGFALNIEIKPTPGDEAATGSKVANEVARLWAGQAAPPLLSSFSPDALRAARDADSRWPRALLLDSLREGWLDEALALGCVAVVMSHRLMDATVIGQLHAAALRALVYTVNDPETAQHLLAIGIDGIITDAVDRFSPDASIQI